MIQSDFMRFPTLHIKSRQQELLIPCASAVDGRSPTNMWRWGSVGKGKAPELDRLMADAHRRRFDAVIVWKFDRFARSVSHLNSSAASLPSG